MRGSREERKSGPQKFTKKIDPHHPRQTKLSSSFEMFVFNGVGIHACVEFAVKGEGSTFH